MSDIYTILKKLNIDYIKHDHPAVFTVEEADKHFPDINACHTKNLFLRNKKGNSHYLVLIKSEKRANLKEIGKYLNENRLSFASPKRLLKYLSLTPGSVSPFGLINDTNKEVTVLIDQDILECGRVALHPNVNTSTLELTSKDLKKFLDYSENKLMILRL